MSGDESGYLSDAAIAGMSGDPALENLRAQPIALILPMRQTVPFIFASPHSGRLYPSSFARQSRLDPVTLRKSERRLCGRAFCGRARAWSTLDRGPLPARLCRCQPGFG